VHTLTKFNWHITIGIGINLNGLQSEDRLMWIAFPVLEYGLWIFLLKVLFLPGTLLLTDDVLDECAYIDQI